MTRQEKQLIKTACEHLNIDYNKIMDAKVYEDRVVIIDSIGRKLTCLRMKLPQPKSSRRPTRRASTLQTKQKTKPKENTAQ